MADPTQIPTFDKCRDTFLRHDIIPVEYTTLVQSAILEQTTIGWLNAVRGFLSKAWLQLASCTYAHEDGQVTSHHIDGRNS